MSHCAAIRTAFTARHRVPTLQGKGTFDISCTISHAFLTHFSTPVPPLTRRITAHAPYHRLRAVRHVRVYHFDWMPIGACNPMLRPNSRLLTWALCASSGFASVVSPLFTILILLFLSGMPTAEGKVRQL